MLGLSGERRWKSFETSLPSTTVTQDMLTRCVCVCVCEPVLIWDGGGGAMLDDNIMYYLEHAMV